MTLFGLRGDSRAGLGEFMVFHRLVVITSQAVSIMQQLRRASTKGWPTLTVPFKCTSSSSQDVHRTVTTFHIASLPLAYSTRAATMILRITYILNGSRHIAHISDKRILTIAPVRVATNSRFTSSSRPRQQRKPVIPHQK